MHGIMKLLKAGRRNIENVIKTRLVLLSSHPFAQNKYYSEET